MSREEWLWVEEKRLQHLDLDAIYSAFSQFSLPPGVFFADVGSALTGMIEGLPNAVAMVYREILVAAVDVMGLDTSSLRVECWSNRAKGGSGIVDYHVDNDEDLRRRTGEVAVPKLGLIFYTGPSKGKVGGTYFNPPINSATEDLNLFRRPPFDSIVHGNGRLVEFTPGSLVLFDGRCPHCVVPFREVIEPRVTIMANFWQN
ncbi:UNVERIFIED_ORG: hypothetical protein J2W66_002666 [Agrobacterium larrymoorei]|nr:hypothetical protein [Agrobacterium larrymoorei]